jgi:hypothetical protein
VSEQAGDIPKATLSSASACPLISKILPSYIEGEFKLHYDLSLSTRFNDKQVLLVVMKKAYTRKQANQIARNQTSCDYR